METENSEQICPFLVNISCVACDLMQTACCYFWEKPGVIVTHFHLSKLCRIASQFCSIMPAQIYPWLCGTMRDFAPNSCSSSGQLGKLLLSSLNLHAEWIMWGHEDEISNTGHCFEYWASQIKGESYQAIVDFSRARP